MPYKLLQMQGTKPAIAADLWSKKKIALYNSTFGDFKPRRGAVVQSFKTAAGSKYLMLFGGQTDPMDAALDYWTSTAGATWKLVTAPTAIPAATKFVFAKTATDENGCLIILGNMGASGVAASHSRTSEASVKTP